MSEYRYDPTVAELVERLAQRGILIVLTGQGPVIELGGQRLADQEAEVLAAHRWNLWRYLPPPTACLACGGPLPGSLSWECQACLDLATGWGASKQKGVA